MEENPDASIEASMFGDDYFPVEPNDGDSLVEILDEESNHALIFIHNQNLFQKCSIKANWIFIDMESSIDVFWNPSLLKNIHSS